MIYLHRIEVFHNPAMIKFLVNLIFTQGMLDVVVFYLIAPTVVEVVNLACYLTELLKIKRFIYLWEATLAQNRKD